MENIIEEVFVEKLNDNNCDTDNTDVNEHPEEDHIDDDNEDVSEQKARDGSDLNETKFEIKQEIDNSFKGQNKAKLMIECHESGCDFKAYNLLQMSIHSENKHQIMGDENDDDFGVHPIDDDLDEEPNNEWFKCSFNDCQFTAANVDDINNHSINSHNSEDKLSADKNNPMIISVENDDNSEDEKEVLCLTGKSLKCQMNNCTYSGRNIHGLRIHLLQKHRIICRESLGKIDDRARPLQTIYLPKRSFACTAPKCGYIGRNSHGLRVHFLRKHDMRVKIKITDKAKPKGGTMVNIDKNELKPKIYTKPIFKIESKVEPKEEPKVRQKSEETEVKAKVLRDRKKMSHKCLTDNCLYESSRLESLKAHLLRKHKLFARIDGQNDTIIIENKPESDSPEDEIEVKTPTHIFECRETDCKFVASNALGLRVHLNQRHGMRIKTNSIIGSANSSVSVDNGVKPKITENTEQMIFKCPIFRCPYVGYSIVGLRFHKRNKHGIGRQYKMFPNRGSQMKNREPKKINAQNDNEVVTNAVPDNRAVNNDKRRESYRLKVLSLKRKSIESEDRNEVQNKVNTNNWVNRNNMKGQNDSDVDKQFVSSIIRKYSRKPNQRQQVFNPNVTTNRNYSGVMANRMANNTINTKPVIARSIPIAVMSTVRVDTGNVGMNKTQFKCQFPGCIFYGKDAEQLKAHVQCIHKNNRSYANPSSDNNLYKCYFPNCQFVGYHSAVLRDHISSQHNIEKQFVQNNQNFKLFKCQHSNCRFGSLTMKGLRIHTKKNHKHHLSGGHLRNAGSKPQMRSIPSNEQQLRRDNCKTAMIFKCGRLNCSKSFTNLIELRQHITQRHN